MKCIKKINVIFLLLLMSSCAAGGHHSNGNHPNLDGLTFDYFSEFIYEEDNYQILFPQNVDKAIFYMYDELDYKTTNKSWTINYYCELIYYTDFDDSLLVNELYSNLVHLIDEIEVLIDDQIELSKPYEMIEKEVTIDNIFNDEISCVFFDEYLPLRLRNTNKNISCSISVPIKRNYLVKSKDKIQNPFNTEIMNWDDFLSIPNIKNNL